MHTQLSAAPRFLPPQPFLKFHNPRSFEDLDQPVPNFKKFALKAGEVPKFFDTVLLKRADEAAAKKADWWNERKAVAAETAAKAAKVSSTSQSTLEHVECMNLACSLHRDLEL